MDTDGPRRLTEFSHGAGCGCKIGPDQLADVLGRLAPVAHPDLLVGSDTGDDAAVWRLDDDRALVVTTDFFTPLVDDARTWGRIAATNAASDVYAMGGRPILALNLVAWPVDALGPEVLAEVLRPVPVARLPVATRVARPGRKVEMLEATLRDDGGSVLALARAWRIRTADVPLTDGQAPADRVEGPDGVAEGRSFFREVPPIGYVQAMETRFASGGWDDPGPATAWLRMRYPLVPDVAPSPLVRTLIAADSGNGVSASFDGLFINPDLTVHLVRPAVGEWVCLQARTTLTDHGVGLAESILHDARGPFGRGAQTLLLDR